MPYFSHPAAVLCVLSAPANSAGSGVKAMRHFYIFTSLLCKKKKKVRETQKEKRISKLQVLSHKIRNEEAHMATQQVGTADFLWGVQGRQAQRHIDPRWPVSSAKW